MVETRECLDEIVDLFESRSGESDPELIDRVVDLYFMTVERQSAEDQDTFGNVMTRMAFAGDAITRARLSERISTAVRIPRELLQRLACDEIAVARPVLQYSPCLREGDLMLIIGQAEEDHLIATAHRRKLTVPVTDLLMERGGEQVLTTLASNTGAQISPEGLKHLTELAQSCSEMQELLDLRHDLSPTTLTRLKRLAEAGFWQDIAVSFLMTEEESREDEPGKAKSPVTGDNPDDPESSGQSGENPDKIDPTVRETVPSDEKALLNAARAGEIEETLKYFSKITLLSETMLEHLLFEAHIPALMVLCKAHALLTGTFTALLQLKESHTGQPSSDTAGLMRRYDGMTRETAQRIIRFSDKRRRLDEAENAMIRKAKEPETP